MSTEDEPPDTQLDRDEELLITSQFLYLMSKVRYTWTTHMI